MIQLRKSKEKTQHQSVEVEENTTEIVGNFYEEPPSQDSCEKKIVDHSYDLYEIDSNFDEKTAEYSKLKKFMLWFNDIARLLNLNFSICSGLNNIQILKL